MFAHQNYVWHWQAALKLTSQPMCCSLNIPTNVFECLQASPGDVHKYAEDVVIQIIALGYKSASQPVRSFLQICCLA